MAKQPAKEQVTSDAKGFLASLKTVGGKHWKEARAKEPRKVGQRIPRGVYEAQVTKVVFGPGEYTKSDGSKGRCPVVRFNFLITAGEYKGANVAKFINLRPDTEQYSEYDYADLSDTLQNFGYEMAKAELGPAVVATLEAIDKEKPLVEIFCNVKNGKGKNAAKEYQSVAVNGTIDGKSSAVAAEAEAEQEDADAETEAVDYVALGEKADEGDEDAQTELQTAAEEAGHNPDDYATWGELAAVLVPEDEEETEAEPDPEPVKPAKKTVAKATAAKPVKKAARQGR